MRRFAAVLLLAAACASPASRIRQNRAAFDAYPPEAQAKIKAGEIAVGFTGEMVHMAMGNPAAKSTRTTAGSTQEIWTYADASVRPSLGVSIGGGSYGGMYGGGVAVGDSYPPRTRAVVVFEGGKVVSVEKLKP